LLAQLVIERIATLKKGTRQHLKDARKIDQVLEQKTKNDILTKREK